MFSIKRKTEPEVWTPEAHQRAAHDYLMSALQLAEMGEKSMADSHFQNALYHEREWYAATH